MMPIPTAQKLDPLLPALNGRHLIEASAGTGKTYNITRLYVRLLLEKSLTVQQILVMTFTKAATEELRGRIEATLRDALTNWDTLSASDDFYRTLAGRVPRDAALYALQQALLTLDEASIYTIHGFCHRVLSGEAFASDVPMEVQMEADTSELLLQAVRDWLRQVNQRPEEFAILHQDKLHTPDAFLKEYRSLLTVQDDLLCPDVASIQAQFEQAEQVRLHDSFSGVRLQVLEALQQSEADILDTLVHGHKDQTVRQDEWASLLAWLQGDIAQPCPKTAGDFINGNRYRKNERIKALFEPFKALRAAHDGHLKKSQTRLNTQVDAAPLNQLVYQAVVTIRQRFLALKQQAAVMDFNDLITHLSRRLTEAPAAEAQALAAVIRRQYPVALVDEFQDTDAHQYAILDALYPKAHHEHALFMIGDPKQAIYGFRGGDIFTYLKARSEADESWHMDTNWRSTEGVVAAYNRIFWGNALNQPANDVFGYGITYEPIHFSSKAKAAGLPLTDPLSGGGRADICLVWWQTQAEENEESDASATTGPINKDEGRTGLALWCVQEIKRLLSEGRLGDAAVQASDIAILVRSANEALVIKEALRAAGLASVYLSDRTNVYESAQALELLYVLQGVLECEQDRLLVRALSTRLMGGTAERLAEFREAEGEDAWAHWRNVVVDLRTQWMQQGCMAMLMSLIQQYYQPEPHDHERALTNMLQLAEHLQQAARRHRQPQQLLKWYRDQCTNPAAAEETELRLESDASLIRLVTQHGSKGLEYPLVFVPFASDYRDPVRVGNRKISSFKYHDPITGALRYQIGESDEALDLSRDEGEAETMRLLYVAITRASHRCYLGIAPFNNSQQSALGKALGVKSTDDWPTRLQAIAVDAAPCLSLIDATTESFGAMACLPDSEAPAELSACTFDRKIDDRWQLASFSMLSRMASHRHPQHKDRDEAEVVSLEPVIRRDELPLRFRLAKGRHAGDLLHDILEHSDFTQPDWAHVLERPLKRFDAEARETLHEPLCHWLQECLDAPLPLLGAATDGVCLKDLTYSQTLREAEFYFPLHRLDLSRLADLLRRHRETGGEIRLPSDDVLQGMMHGFIDLIFESQGRYYVADYKSSHLGDRFEDYHRAAMEANMQSHFYDLQYLIYSLVLHRYLATKLGDGYRAGEHFGGVYYFYLRGMSPAHPGSGIYGREISPDTLQTLDELFRGEIPVPDTSASVTQKGGEQRELF